MTRSQSNAMSPDGSPSSAISPPCAIVVIIESQRGRGAGHLQPDVEALDHAELGHDLVERRRGDVDRAASAPIERASSSRSALTSVITTCRAPA